MAYLTLTSTEDKNSGIKFIGANSRSNNGGLICSTTTLITNNTSLITASADGGLDTCSFYTGPSDSTILAFGESYESCGSIAYDSVAGGSFGYSGASESCGSIASASCSSDSSFSGSSCSYSC